MVFTLNIGAPKYVPVPVLKFEHNHFIPYEMRLKTAGWVANTVDWSAAAFFGIWLGSTPFAQTWLFQYV